MRRVQLEPAWVLSARPYRETSALVEIFAQQSGRTGLVARGVRGPRARIGLDLVVVADNDRSRTRRQNDVVADPSTKLDEVIAHAVISIYTPSAYRT